MVPLHIVTKLLFLSFASFDPCGGISWKRYKDDLCRFEIKSNIYSCGLIAPLNITFSTPVWMMIPQYRHMPSCAVPLVAFNIDNAV